VENILIAGVYLLCWKRYLQAWVFVPDLDRESVNSESLNMLDGRLEANKQNGHATQATGRATRGIASEGLTHPMTQGNRLNVSFRIIKRGGFDGISYRYQHKTELTKEIGKQGVRNMEIDWLKPLNAPITTSESLASTVR